MTDLNAVISPVEEVVHDRNSIETSLWMGAANISLRLKAIEHVGIVNWAQQVLDGGDPVEMEKKALEEMGIS